MGYLESLEAASHVGTAVTISMSLSSQHLGMSLELKYRRDRVIQRA